MSEPEQLRTTEEFLAAFDAGRDITELLRTAPDRAEPLRPATAETLQRLRTDGTPTPRQSP